MNKPYFSIIIPIYNVEKFLPQCLDSVINQTYNNLEIILVDDASPDNCGAICDKYAKSDNRIKIIHKENGGASDARNVGINHATGEYIIFLDGDDYFCDINCFQKFFDYCSQTFYDFVLFKSQKAFVEKGLYIDYYGDYDPTIFETNDTAKIFKYMVSQHKQLACCWNKVIKRDLFLKNDLFFIKGTIGEDIEWIIRLFDCSKNIGILNEIVHSYRQDVSTSVTATKSEKSLWDLFHIIEHTSLERKNKTDAFSQAVLSFMAFEYAILLYSISDFKDINQFNKIKELDWVLKYSIDKKSVLVKYLYCILGFKNTIKFLGKVKRFI